MKIEHIQHQARSFRCYYDRQGGDIEQVFGVWCDAKDFRQDDRDRIWRVLNGLPVLWEAS